MDCDCDDCFAPLRTCRQMYHEARKVLYSANTVEFVNPRSVSAFLRYSNIVSDRSLAVRSVHLSIHVSDRSKELEWDRAIHALAESLKNLQHLHIDVEETIWNYPKTRRHTPTLRKRPFLRRLLELKQLPLKTFELIMSKSSRSPHRVVCKNQYRWTMDQQRAWAQSIQNAILSTD